MATIIVHVAEGEAALYAAGSALLGVALGAGASWLQQRAKIGADKAQLNAQLNAEEKRLDTQLAHDREMREREALRDVLDDALDAARIAYGWIANSSNRNTFGQRPSNTGAIGLAGSRLVIRLGRGHPVVARYRELREVIEAAYAIILPPLNGEDPVTRKRVLKKEIDNGAKALVIFADAAADLVGGPMAHLGVASLDSSVNDPGVIADVADLESVTESSPSTWD